MPHVKHPHTTIAYERNGRRETIGRAGTLNSPDVDALMKARGITGKVVVRHHEAARSNAPAKVSLMFEHVIR